MFERSGKQAYSPHAISYMANPYYYPLQDPRYPLNRGVQLTLGDTHGCKVSVIGMLHFHQGWTFTKQQFDRLVDIVLLPRAELIRPVRMEFFNILMAAPLSEETQFALLRLLGDDFGDRVCSDDLGLLLRKALRIKGLSVISPYSNHVLEFHFPYEMDIGFDRGFCMAGELIASSTALQEAIDDGHYQRSEIDEMIEEDFLPAICAIDFSIGRDNLLTYHSHSWCDRVISARIGKDFGLDDLDDFLSDDVQLRIMALEALQEKVQDAAKTKTLTDYVTIGDLDVDDIDIMNSTIWSGLGRLIWLRFQTVLQRYSQDRYVNGHTFADEVPDNVYLLNNYYGQIPFHQEYLEFNQEYKALYTHESRKLDYWYFREAYNEIRASVNVQLIPLLGGDTVADILNEYDIYSTYQIETLKFLFCEEGSYEWWTDRFSCHFIIPPVFVEQMKKVEFRNLIYLLHTMKALSHSTIQLLMQHCSDENVVEIEDTIFSALLVLKEREKLCHHNVVESFLLCDSLNLRPIYRAFIEMRQAEAPSAVFYSLFDMTDLVEIETLRQMYFLKNLIRRFDANFNENITQHDWAYLDGSLADIQNANLQNRKIPGLSREIYNDIIGKFIADKLLIRDTVDLLYQVMALPSQEDILIAKEHTKNLLGFYAYEECSIKKIKLIKQLVEELQANQIVASHELLQLMTCDRVHFIEFCQLWQYMQEGIKSEFMCKDRKEKFISSVFAEGNNTKSVLQWFRLMKKVIEGNAPKVSIFDFGLGIELANRRLLTQGVITAIVIDDNPYDLIDNLMILVEEELATEDSLKLMIDLLDQGLDCQTIVDRIRSDQHDSDDDSNSDYDNTASLPSDEKKLTTASVVPVSVFKQVDVEQTGDVVQSQNIYQGGIQQGP